MPNKQIYPRLHSKNQCPLVKKSYASNLTTLSPNCSTQNPNTNKYSNTFNQKAQNVKEINKTLNKELKL